MNNGDDLTAAERREFQALPLEMDVPDGLEERVITALRRGNLLAAGGHWWRAPSPAVIALATAACLVTLVLGIGIGRSSVEAQLPRASFILFLHAGPEFEPNSAANFDARFGAYNEWVAETRQSGHFITGEQLDDTGLILLPSPTRPLVEDRIARSADGDVLGMFLITAADYDEATRVAMALPHLRFGGRVAIRRVDPI